MREFEPVREKQPLQNAIGVVENLFGGDLGGNYRARIATEHESGTMRPWEQPHAMAVAERHEAPPLSRYKSNTGAWSEYDFRAFDALNNRIGKLENRSISDFNKSVDPDVGCIATLSQVLKGWGYNFNEVNTRSMEKALRDARFSQVDNPRDIRPGDIILAYRNPGDYSHGAVYRGNGQIFNNDSISGRMRTESIEKFNSAEFKKLVILRRPSRVPSLEM